MKKTIILIIPIALFILLACNHNRTKKDNYKHEYGELNDERDGRTYKTIQIENQIWMAENLSFESDGSSSYNKDINNDKTTGRYYPWKEAQSACPKGWHLPTEQEWISLIKNSGGWSASGKNLLVGGSSGFNTELSGYVNTRKESFYLNTDSYYWTSTEDGHYKWCGRYFCIDAVRDKIQNYFLRKNFSFCVRCLQDELAESSKKLTSTYNVNNNDIKLANKLLTTKEIPNIKFPNPHPDAQWFSKPNLGLFLVWGIHSIKQFEPSWVMLKNDPWGIYENYEGTKYYDSLAPKFNPDKYDPDKWIAAAKDAGFTYAVFSAKHHDGYGLWASKYGNMNIGYFANGKDLLKPYVDACRKYGLKVGIYFSPRDWHYPDCPMIKWGYNYIDMHNEEFPYKTKKEGKEHWENFYAYTIGQLNEILSNYGKIDLLWFDGQANMLTKDMRLKQTINWIRQKQPGIIVNNRWYMAHNGSYGDFYTAEGHFPGKQPKGWWELCDHGSPTWGYCPNDPVGSVEKFIADYKRVAEWGGSFLYSIGPAPDGRMPPEYYIFCKEAKELLKKEKFTYLYKKTEKKRVIL